MAQIASQRTKIRAKYNRFTLLKGDLHSNKIITNPWIGYFFILKIENCKRLKVKKN